MMLYSRSQWRHFLEHLRQRFMVAILSSTARIPNPGSSFARVVVPDVVPCLLHIVWGHSTL